MAKLIKPDGTTVEIEPKNGKNFRLEELYDLIGCRMVQICDADSGPDGVEQTLIFDEEFLCRGDIVSTPNGPCLEKRDENGNTTLVPYLNRTATDAMASYMGPYVYNIICGNAVLCERREFV